jgi:hypothetical protein
MLRDAQTMLSMDDLIVGAILHDFQVHVEALASVLVANDESD